MNRSILSPLIAVALVLAWAAPSIASSPAPKAEGGHGDKEAGHDTKSEGPVDIELPPILAPMVVNGKLTGYAYITVALSPAGRDKILPIRAKVPFLQDAFLRELNKGSIMKVDDPKAVDVDATKLRLFAQTKGIVGAGVISAVKFEQVVLAPVKPE